VLVVISVNFLLGLGLGYVSFRALKYVLAFVAMLFLGFFLLNVVSGVALVDALQRVGAVMKKLVATFYLTVFGPIFFGFLVGALIALTRKQSPKKSARGSSPKA
jgi:inner membrane protein involved in colicin E2 resistance